MSYQIKWGNTLSQLAQKFGTTVQALAQKNNIKNPDLIYAGDTLIIPGKGFAGKSSFGGSTPDVSSRLQGRDGVGGAAAPSLPPLSGGTAGGVSQAELLRIMPGLSPAKAAEYLPHLNAAMKEANITTPQRQAAFLAQLSHESGGLKYMEEIASGAAYEGRRDLGNTQPGDGTRYKGRGPIQLTGRANYRAAGQALGIDLEGNPGLATRPDVAFRIATWYWSSRNLNQYADRGDFSSITYRINGGYNGAADRNRLHNIARSVLA